MSFFALSEALAQAPIKTTFVSGSGRGGQEGPAMICDDQLSTKWCIDFPRLMPYSIVLDAGQQTGVVEYGLVTGDDTNAYPERNPVTWKVSGSNDKENWTTLDTRSDETGWTLGEKRYFAFRNETTYSHYRILFTSVVDPTANKYGGFLQIENAQKDTDDLNFKINRFSNYFNQFCLTGPIERF